MKAKKIALILSIIFTLTISNSYAQEEGNVGLYVGASSYFGELNQYIPFINPSYVVGIIYRHNYGYRFAFRLGVNYVNLRGSSNYSLDDYEKVFNRQFSYSFGEIYMGGEFNFFRFDKERYEDYYLTPYIWGGSAFITTPDPYNAFDFSFPIGFGIKYAYNKKIAIGVELNYYWTYTDYLDRIPKDNYRYRQQSYNSNFDSYMIGAFFITYRLFRTKAACPVYTYF